MKKTKLPKEKPEKPPDDWLAGGVVLDATRHIACRLAVLTPVLGSWWSNDGDRLDRVRQALTKLRHRWLATVRQLGAARWSGFGPDNGGYYLRTCPPFGIYLPPRRVCGRRVICPFCYARQTVRQAFCHLERHLEEHYLLEFVSARHSPAFAGMAELQQVIVSSETDQLLSHRAVEVRFLHPARAAVVQRLWPEGDRLQSLRGGLLLLREPPPPHFPWPAETAWRLHEGPTRRTLAEACGRVLAYPAPLLTAPAEQVVALLEGLRHRRLLSLYGPKDTEDSDDDVDSSDLPGPAGAPQP